MQIREDALPRLDPAATRGAAAPADMASGDPAAIAATRRTFARRRNLRITCSFLVRCRSAAVEGPTTPPYNSRCAPRLLPGTREKTGREDRANPSTKAVETPQVLTKTFPRPRTRGVSGGPRWF